MKLTCVLSMSCAQVGKLDPSTIHFMWQTQKNESPTVFLIRPQLK